MASFLARLIRNSGGSLPANPPNAFTDDNSDSHQGDINALAAAHVVSGTGFGHYDPVGFVTRAQMATFLVRTYDYRTETTLPHDYNYFSDISKDSHRDDINAAAEAAFTNGYPNGTYGPGQSVSRDQMASFLARVLDLLVVDGDTTPPGNG